MIKPLAIDVASVVISHNETGLVVHQGEHYSDGLGKDECLWTIVSILSGTDIPYGGMKTKEQHEQDEIRRFRRSMETRFNTSGHPKAKELADMSWKFGGPDHLKASCLYSELVSFNKGE